jgi:hypothetical protein
MGAPISDLQDFFELQMQQSNEKKISKSKTVIFCLKCFEKKTLNLSSLKPHIFFIIFRFE